MHFSNIVTSLVLLFLKPSKKIIVNFQSSFMKLVLISAPYKNGFVEYGQTFLTTHLTWILHFSLRNDESTDADGVSKTEKQARLLVSGQNPDSSDCPSTSLKQLL